MKLTTISLQNFRSYKQLQFKPTNEPVQVLFGPNGVGKTNVLEAIVLLSLTKSFQSREEQDMVRWTEGFYRLQAELENETGKMETIEVASQLEPRKRKAFFYNDVSKKASQLVGILPTVQFFPQDLDLFTGSPSRRRHFLDQLLCQVSSEYLRHLSQYQQVLKQRNALLKKIHQQLASRDGLPVWDQQLAELGAAITVQRLELMQLWQLSITDELNQLGEQFTAVAFVYTRKGTATNIATLTTELTGLLEQQYNRDIATHSTSVGPHRDDWYLQVDEHNFTSFASRGQQRAALLALVLLETSFLELKRGKRPIILLDDVFSEFDEHHQLALLDAVQQSQVFITSAIKPPVIANAAYWQVEPGTVTQVTI